MVQSQEEGETLKNNHSEPITSIDEISAKDQNEDLREVTSVLCPSYKIKYSEDGIIKCNVTFPLNTCGNNIKLYVEVWVLGNRLLQSTKKDAFVDCNSSLTDEDR